MQRGGESTSNILSYLVTDINKIDNGVSFLQKLYGWPYNDTLKYVRSYVNINF